MRLVGGMAQHPSTPDPTTEALVRLSFAMHARMAARASMEQVSVTQIRLLGILRDRQPTMNELGALLDLDKSSVSGLVDRAVARGLVQRERHEHDGRAVRVRLEARGRELIEGITERFEADLATLLGTLSGDEQRQWRQLTERLLLADAEEREIPARAHPVNSPVVHDR